MRQMKRNCVGKVWRPTRKRGVHESHRHGLAQNLREFVWPTMGIVAFGRWMALKLLRQANRPHYVALGAALGVMTGFFPILGTHTLIMAGLCFSLRASFVAAMLGSMIANPWTIGPMWAASFHLGRKILGMGPGSAQAIDHLNGMGWGTILGRLDVLLGHVILPTVVGGIFLGGPLAVLVYVIVYWRLRRRRARSAT